MLGFLTARSTKNKQSEPIDIKVICTDLNLAWGVADRLGDAATAEIAKAIDSTKAAAQLENEVASKAAREDAAKAVNQAVDEFTETYMLKWYIENAAKSSGCKLKPLS